jgi:hypothetical protein
VTTAVVDGTTYLFVAGSADSGVSVFSVAADGTLTNVANVSDDATLELLLAADVTTAVAGGIVHLFVAGASDSGVSAFALDGNVPLLGDVLWQHSDGTVATAAQELGSLPIPGRSTAPGTSMATATPMSCGATMTARP